MKSLVFITYYFIKWLVKIYLVFWLRIINLIRKTIPFLLFVIVNLHICNYCLLNPIKYTIYPKTPNSFIYFFRVYRIKWSEDHQHENVNSSGQIKKRWPLQELADDNDIAADSMRKSYCRKWTSAISGRKSYCCLPWNQEI